MKITRERTKTKENSHKVIPGALNKPSANALCGVSNGYRNWRKRLSFGSSGSFPDFLNAHLSPLSCRSSCMPSTVARIFGSINTAFLNCIFYPSAYCLTGCWVIRLSMCENPLDGLMYAFMQDARQGSGFCEKTGIFRRGWNLFRPLVLTLSGTRISNLSGYSTILLIWILAKVCNLCAS